MAKVYISHSKKDFEIARAIASGMTRHGHEVWSDENLKPGSDWRSELQDNLAQADAVVALITRDSIESQWVVSEVSSMLAYSRERGRGGVIPVWFDDVELPNILQDIQAIRADRDDLELVIEEIANAVDRMVGFNLAREQKQQERREILERVASEFIAQSQENLKSRERKYRNLATMWYLFACGVMIAGVGLSLWRVNSVDYSSSNIYSLVEVIFLGAISVGIILAIAKFSFTLGKSYMVESLRNADRSHAISFGEFYLKSYGSESEWGELKEAFQHWNIDSGSVFSDQKTADFDPKLIETAMALAKLMTDKANPSK